jgi:hypothetical protein
MDEYVKQLMEQLGEVIPEDKREEAQQLVINAMNEANKGLEKNKGEILGKLAKLKEKQKLLDKIDISDYNNMKEAQKQLDELLEQKAKDEGNYKELVERLEKKHSIALQALQTEIDNLKTADQRKTETLQKTLIDNGLTDSLTKLNTKPELLDAARALLRVKASLNEAEDGNYSALIEGKPMTDYISEWASNEGKAFISAPKNTGAGSTDGKGKGGTMSLDEIAQIKDQGERLKAMEAIGY